MTTNGTLFGLDYSGDFLQSPNTSATMPQWNTIGTSGTRLIGHGTALYRAQGIVY